MNTLINNQSKQDDISLLENKNAVIVSVNTGNSEMFYYQLTELKHLCSAANITVLSEIVQNLTTINYTTYVGKGKLEEINQEALALEADLIIFNDELSPAQLKNIDEIISPEIDVWDRTMLILDIFKLRAKTKEATLQVEIANLKYTLPRLIGQRRYLSRTAGGGAGGGGARRGLGETKLELDRRHIERKIIKAQEDLVDITKARMTTRDNRKANEIPTVSLVGYTNVGKSSTLNTILNLNNEKSDEKNVFVKDMLFATLGTATRYVKLSNNHEFLLTDTVGFVSKLPHHLVESFKSTLEEIKESALIVHVIDASSPFMEMQINTTSKVLEELGCSKIKTIYAFNKADLLKIPIIPIAKYNPSVIISSKTREGYDELLKMIDQELFPNTFLDEYIIPYDKGNIFSKLKEKAQVVSSEYCDNGIYVKAYVSEYLHNLYKEYRK